MTKIECRVFFIFASLVIGCYKYGFDWWTIFLCVAVGYLLGDITNFTEKLF